MKKIWSLFKIFLIVAISVSYTPYTFADKVDGNSYVIREERQIKYFNGINVSAGIDVIITHGNEEYIKIEADENLLKYLITEVRGSTLKIFWKPNISIGKYKKVVVYITCSNLYNIKASSGSNIFSKDTLEAPKINISTSSSAYVDIIVKTEKIVCKASNSANVNLKGNTKIFKALCCSSANIKASHLKAYNVDVKASNGADIITRVIENINALATSGGDITFYGNPKIKKINFSSGGNIKHR